MSNAFVSFLGKIGTEAKKVFGWLASPTGQKVLQGGEGVVETAAAILAPAVAPEVDAAITLANVWIAKAITVETVATAASQQAGTGMQKAAAVIASLAPYIKQYEQQAGAAPLTVDQTTAINNAIVAFLNALSAGGSAQATSAAS